MRSRGASVFSAVASAGVALTKRNLWRVRAKKKKPKRGRHGRRKSAHSKKRAKCYVEASSPGAFPLSAARERCCGMARGASRPNSVTPRSSDSKPKNWITFGGFASDGLLVFILLESTRSHCFRDRETCCGMAVGASRPNSVTPRSSDSKPNRWITFGGIC